MDYVMILMGILGAAFYALLGYSAQDKPFDAKKFLTTFVIGTFLSLGLDLTGMNFNIYTALVGPTAITVWLQKLIETGGIKAKAKEA